MRDTYSGTAQFLHWATFGLLLVMFVTGFWIASMDNALPLKLTLRGFHRSIGLTIMLLTIVRVVYRINNPPPHLPGEMPEWQAEIARTVQWVFFGLMIFMPLVGWGYVNTLGQTVHFWWLFNLPAIATTAEDSRELLDWAHEYGAYFFILVVMVHVMGAAYHGAVKRDGVFSSMWPGVRN